MRLRPRDRALLSLRLPLGWPEGGLPVAWWLHEASGAVRRGEVSRLDELSPPPHSTRVRVWTPAAETMLAQVTLPTKSRARIAQALPYALEDQLLGEPDSLHFAYRSLGGGSLAVGVTERARLQAWVDAFKASGLQPTVLCPEVFALPWNDSVWSLTGDGGELIVRTGAWSGFPCDLSQGADVPEALVIAIRGARAGTAAPESLSFYNPPAGIDFGRWSETLGLPVRGMEQDFWAQESDSPELSLLQNEFSPTNPLHQTLGALRPAGVILLAWFLISLGVNIGTWWHLKRVELAQRREMYELFRHSFPDAHVIVDPALQMARQLAALQSGSGQPVPGDFLPLLADAAPAIQSVPGGHLSNLSYSGSSLTIDVRVTDYQAVEALRSALVAHGLRAKVLDATSHRGVVDGRIRVKAEGSP